MNHHPYNGFNPRKHGTKCKCGGRVELTRYTNGDYTGQFSARKMTYTCASCNKQENWSCGTSD